MRLFTLFLYFGFSIVCFGQGKQEKELLKQVDKAIEDNFSQFAPGGQLLIAKKGQVVYHKGFGLANLELGMPMSPEMVLRIGSITKQFTAVAILQLVEKGEISLNDSIQKFIKHFGFKGKTITVENLLTHTSGIRGYEQLDAGIPNAIRVDFPAKTVIDSLDRLSLEFEPGTRYQYSNSNYFLLGYIVEQVSGKTYQQYLEDHIIRPVGLNSTFYDNPSKVIPNRASGYAFSERSYANADYISMSLVYSAGALLSNVGDLFKWHQALASGQLIRKETLQKAITAYVLSDGRQINYGYGFFVQNTNGLHSIGHGGAIDGFRATEMYYPEEEIYIACLLNSDRDNDAGLFRIISDIVMGLKTDDYLREISLSGDVLDKYLGTYKNEEFKVSIRVYRAKGRIYGDLSNGTGSYMAFVAQSETTFLLPDITRIKTTAEFILENEKVVKLIMTQEKAVEFLKAD